MATFYLQISTTSGNKGEGSNCSVSAPPNINSPISSSNAAHTQYAPTDSSPLALSVGDTLSLKIVTNNATNVQVRPLILDTNERQSSMARPQFFYFFSPDTSWGVSLLSPGNTYTATVLPLTTGNNTVEATFTAFLGKHARLPFKISGDGLPTAPADRTTATSALDTYYYTSFTVSGLATGTKAFYFAMGGAEVKVGSGAYSGRAFNGEHLGVLAANGDTVTVRAKSPAALDFKKLVQIYGMQGDGQYTMTRWTLGPTSNTDATYGMAFFNSSGNKLLNINDRSARFVASGNLAFTGHVDGSEKIVVQNITGMTNSDIWSVFVYLKPGQGGEANGVVLREVTKASGSFSVKTFQNNYTQANNTYYMSYVVVKQG
jgi:hypothetical protein